MLFSRKNKYPLDTFSISIEKTQALKKLINETSCPHCTQKTLLLDKYTNAFKGWDAEFHCSNCQLNGVVNSTGFEFKIAKKVKIL